MEAHRSLNYRPDDTSTSYPARLQEPPQAPGLELQSSILTAGRDLYLNINSGSGKQSLPDIRQLAHWLSPLNQHQFHKDVFDKVTPGTGEWILHSPEFMDWLARRTTVLWGTGIPGAGKTCLSSIIINHLTHREQKTVVFFYCQYKEQPSINEVLSCLLKQMVEGSEVAAQYVAMTLHASCARTDTRPSRSELSKSLNELARKLNSLFFVVDALDELPDDTRSDLVTELAALEVPLLMTSRPLPNLLDLMPTEFAIRPPEHDFHTFISATISRVLKLRPFLRNSSLCAEVVKTIQDKSDGMFLLAALQIEALASAGIVNAHSLREAVKRLPDTLNNQYKLTLQRIQTQSPEERDLALRVILWVTHATVYLQVDQLLDALTVNVELGSIDENQRTTEETLISVCLGLLEVERETGMVRLIHYTAQEFLEAQHGLLLKSPHEYISNACAIYLNWIQVDFPSFTTQHENPFFRYSCLNLGYHTYQATIENHDQIPTRVVKFFSERGHALIPIKLFGDLMDFGHTIHFAAAYGLVLLFEEHEGRIDQQSLFGYTPLFYACLGGHLALVERIVTQYPAGLTCKTGSGATVLHAAAHSGHSSLTKELLLTHGLEPPSGALHPIPSVLPIEGYPCIDINAQMVDERTALYIASEGGNLPVVEALLDHTAINVNLGKLSGWTPLHISSYNGHESIVRVLLKCPRIDVNVMTRDGWTPLHIAAETRNSLLLNLLLNYPGINANAKDAEGRTPLHYAVRLDDETAIQMLLDSPGIDINAVDNDGFTPLHGAACYGQSSIVRLFLSAPGIYLIAKEQNGWTALHYAARNGHAAVVEALLSAGGIGVHARGTGDLIPLHPTTCNIVAEAPLNSGGIGADTRCNHGCTPLSLASEYGHTDIARAFLDRALANINNIDDDGETPLMCAAYNGHTSVAELLLGHPQIQVNVHNKEHGRTALSLACDASKAPTVGGTKTENEAYPFIALLLAHKSIDINLADDEGKTPLYYASRSGFQQVVELLEARGAIMKNSASYASCDRIPEL